MSESNRKQLGSGLLTRVLRDVRGATLPLVGFALITFLALIGGGIDMSRIYLTKTRLQQACDAGALAGRKSMGGSVWTTGTSSTEATALAMFGGNFQQGDYGTGTLTRGYVESNGEVTGTASSVVPMAIMRVFGVMNRTIAVSCTAKLAIPNTDVMFVLDVTGSMAGTKIAGLKSAVKCFYEAIEKVNTPELCVNSGAGDPTANAYNGTAQIRVGFVPYSVNVNVGKLLPNDFLANIWNYQTRVANKTQVWTWTLGSIGTTTWGEYSDPPSDITAADSYSGWSTTNGSATLNGTTYVRYPNANSSSACTAPNNNSGAIAYVDTTNSTGSSSLQSTSDNPPTYPDSQQTLTYAQTQNHSTRAYKYTWDNSWNSNKCRLQSASRSYVLSHSGDAPRPIAWKEVTRFDSWTYKQDAIDVSGLKAGDSSWNNSISIPNLTTTSIGSYKASGSNTSYNYSTPSASTVTWDGCIEERQTVQNSDQDPSDEWNTIPSAALDMNIDLVPDSGIGTQWAPILNGVEWARYSNTAPCESDPSQTCSGDTRSDVVTSSNLSRNFAYYCPVESKRLREWKTSSDRDDFVTYVDSLSPTGNTYHDIGLIWGARLISPTGIFASTNNNLNNIQRHIIFMTDGDTNVVHDDYSAYGVHWWDRRQTTYAPSDTNLDNILNARMTALCTAINNMNITVWVVSYGTGVGTATQNRLKACASDDKAVHYMTATSTSSLISQFQQIASAISELRLTN